MLIHRPLLADLPLRARGTLLAGALALVGGCAMQRVTVTSAWPDTPRRDQNYSRVFVVGVSPDTNRRCAFEWALVSRLKSEHTQAVASCDAMSLQEPLTRATVEAAVRRLEADSVLATSLVTMKMGTREGGGRDTRGAGYYKATDIGFESGYFAGYGPYDATVIYAEYQTAPAITTIKGRVHVATKLYDVKTATLVYSLDTRAATQDLESTEAGIAMITAPIAARLRRDGVVR